jgi:hypothetical protein
MDEAKKLRALVALDEARDLIEQTVITSPAGIERLWALNARVLVNAARDYLEAVEPVAPMAPASAEPEPADPADPALIE